MKNKNITFYQGAEIKQIHKKIIDVITKNEKKIKKLDNKINKLYEKNASIKRIIKLETKRFNIEQKIIRQKLNLEKLNAGKLEKLSLYQQFKKWFSNIKYGNQRIAWGFIFIIPWILGMLILFIPSLFTTFLWSFSKVELVTGGVKFSFIGIDNFVYLFTSYVIDNTNIFSVTLINFIQNLVIDLPIIIIFSILIAVMLNKKFKGHLIIKSIFFIPVIYNFRIIATTMTGSFGQLFEGSLSAQTTFVDSFTRFFLEIGIGDSLIEIVISSIERIFTIIDLSGIQILIFIAAIQAVPRHLYEAAEVEGATKYESFWKITVPMITPMILTASIYTVIDSFTRAPIFRFLEYSMTANRYGLASAISVSYFVINITIIGIIFLLFRGRVFYYDE